MRSFVLLIGLVVAACTPHAGGESCPWVPGDDGSCERGGGGSGSGPTLLRHGSPSAAWTEAGHRVVYIASGDGSSTLETALVDGEGVPSEAFSLEVRGEVAEGRTPTVTSNGSGYLVVYNGWDNQVHAARFSAADAATSRHFATGADPRYLTAAFGGSRYLAAWIDPFESALHLMTVAADGDLDPDERVVAEDITWDRISLAAGERGAVLTWQRSDDLGRELLALRLHADGRAADAEPIVLARVEYDDDVISTVGPIAHAGDDLYVMHYGTRTGAIIALELDGRTGALASSAAELTSVPNAMSGDERGLIAAVPAGDRLAVDRFDRAGRRLDSVGSFSVVDYYAGIALGAGENLVVARGDGGLEALRFDAHSSRRLVIAEDHELGGCRAGGASGLPGALLLLVALAASRCRRFWKGRASMLPQR